MIQSFFGVGFFIRIKWSVAQQFVGELDSVFKVVHGGDRLMGGPKWKTIRSKMKTLQRHVAHRWRKNNRQRPRDHGEDQRQQAKSHEVARGNGGGQKSDTTQHDRLLT